MGPLANAQQFFFKSDKIADVICYHPNMEVMLQAEIISNNDREATILGIVLWFCCGVQFLGKLASSCRHVFTQLSSNKFCSTETHHSPPQDLLSYNTYLCSVSPHVQAKNGQPRMAAKRKCSGTNKKCLLC